MKIFLLGGLFFWLLLPFVAHSQCGPTNHGGADWIISASTTIGGTHTNVGKFQIEIGVTVTVDSACRYLEVQADTIVVYGNINADGKGDVGGSGGAGGAFANGSGVPGHAGQAGFNGYGSGGGNAGAVAGDGGYITQICGGLFCSGNRDGENGGGGGAGGGSGGTYAGMGGAGGYGAYGSGYTGAEGGNYGAGGTRSTAHGTAAGIDITWGSGGAGGGGGGGGWATGTSGGKGGAGGGMVTLKAQHKLIISGSVSCNGTDGGVGGNGGGESDDNSLDCSTSGYNACGAICTESVFDAAGGAGGAGGGGSGGGIVIESNGSLNITGTLSVRGGGGGTAGTPSNLTGTCFDNARGGAGGGGGRVKILKNPCVTVLMNPVVNTSGGIGGNGVVTGNNGDSGSYRNNLTAQAYVALDGGTIASVDSVFCNFGDVPLIGSTVTASGGILGTYSYQWQYSTTDSVNGYVNLPGQISATCDPGLISITTWYRRKVTSGSCTDYSNFAKALVIDCSAIDEANQLDFNVYPVPSDGRFKIEMPQPIPAGSSVEIYNQLGEKISLIQIKESVSEVAVNLKVMPGMYFVLVRTTDKQGLRKITIE